jgi:hypothetical protein
VTTSELARILGVKVFRVHFPLSHNGQWTISVLKPKEVKISNTRSVGLTTTLGLFAFRETEKESVYQYTLPEAKGVFSQGKLDICKEIECGGQHDIEWFKTPRYSADGTQCLLAKISVFESGEIAYLALVLP